MPCEHAPGANTDHQPARTTSGWSHPQGEQCRDGWTVFVLITSLEHLRVLDLMGLKRWPMLQPGLPSDEAIQAPPGEM